MSGHRFKPGRVAVVINERGDLSPVLGDLRVRAGWTCLELDHRAGFHDGYTGKLEARNAKPETKRWGLSMRPGDISVSNAGQAWLDVLGCCLVLVDKDTAAAIGAQEAPKLPPGYRRPAPNRKPPSGPEIACKAPSIGQPGI